MRVTGPTRRRNQAWVGVRDRMGRLARRQVPVEEEEEEGVESESSDSESDINGEVSDMSDSDLEDDSDDEEETISPPGATPTAGVGAGVGVSRLPDSSATLTTSTRSTASSKPTDSSLGQQLTSVGVEPTPLPTLSTSPTAPVAGGAQSLDSSNGANQPQGETLGLTQDNTMNTGEAVGIVIGVLALLGLVIGGAFFWKKFRSDRGLPFLPPRLSNLSNRFSRKRDGADDMDEKLVPPTFPAAGNTKTNTKIMDELMQAAYDADNGNNNMEFFGAFGQDKKVPQLPQPQPAPFMDEKAYIALAGQLTPRTPKKPVSQWLSAVQTPRQSQGPKFPPSPMLPPDAYVPPIRNNPNAIPGTIAGPRLQPPKAMTVRDTMTTNTTNTSVRWYG